MAMLARYHRETGQIVGVWSAPHTPLLLAQQTQDDPTYGSLLVPDQDPISLQTRYGVSEGQLVACQELTLTATPSPFVADGQSICTVTVSPFEPCTLRVQQTAYALTAADPVLEITSDEPMGFVITLVPRPGWWAVPLTVEAT